MPGRRPFLRHRHVFAAAVGGVVTRSSRFGLRVLVVLGSLEAAGAAGAWEARMRRQAEEASWRQAAGVRPTIPATSAKE